MSAAPAPAPWPALLRDVDALATRYASALQSSRVPGPDVEVADAIASTLAILSDVARTSRTRLEARALMHTALADLLRGELEARVTPQEGSRP